jgi:hypothetical protein
MSVKAAPILQEHGLFWWNEEPLPDRHFAPPSAVGGLLTIEAEHISLKLDGLLPNQENIIDTILTRQGERIDKAIQGVLSASGKRVLLPDLIRHGGQFRTNAPSTQEFLAFDCLMADSPFPAGGCPEILSMTINLSGLQPWFESEPLKIQRTETMVSATYTHRSNASYQLENETIQINFGPGIKRSSGTLSLSDVIWLVHSAREPTHLDQQIDLFGLLNDFFILLTGSDFSLRRPTLKLRDGQTCELYLFRGALELEILNQKECWTTFPQLRAQFGDHWRRWVQLREHSGPGIYLYLSTLRRKDLYPEHRFVNLVWGLEAFHRKNHPPKETTSVAKKIERLLDQIDNKKDRKWLEGKLKHADEPSLADRIAFIVSSLPIGFDRKAVNVFAAECANLRNEISHFGGNKDSSYPDFLDKVERYSRALSTLYHYLILHEIGVDPKRLNEWINEGSRSYVIRQEFIAVGLVKREKPKGRSGL